VWLARKAVVSTSCRPERSLPRYGGDEFVVVSELDGLESRLRSAFADPLRTRYGILEIGVDVGVTAWRRGLALADVLAEADRRMPARKWAG
jgi:GGDEF domain-containing protein